MSGNLDHTQAQSKKLDEQQPSRVDAVSNVTSAPSPLAPLPQQAATSADSPEHRSPVPACCELGPPSGAAIVATERKCCPVTASVAARKRQDQKRFRQRSKERSQAASTLLADTQQRLQQAEAQRSTLEARNRILEAFISAQTNLQAGPSQSFTSACPERLPQWTSRSLPAIVKPLLLPHVALTSCDGQVQYMAAEDIASMPIKGFAKLYTVRILLVPLFVVSLLSAQKLARSQHEFFWLIPFCCLHGLRLNHVCLLQTAIQRLCTRLQYFEPEVESQHQQLVASTLEPLSLILSLLACKPTRAPQFTQLSMAEGAEQQRPLDAAVLALMSYSEAQMQDMLVLRYLTFSEIGRLTSERIHLVSQMTEHSQQLQKVEAWAQRIQQNIQEEHAIYVQSAVAGYLGISTAQQAAIGMTASYPGLLNRNALEEYALLHGEPSIPDIINTGCSRSAPPKSTSTS